MRFRLFFNGMCQRGETKGATSPDDGLEKTRALAKTVRPECLPLLSVSIVFLFVPPPSSSSSSLDFRFFVVYFFSGGGRKRRMWGPCARFVAPPAALVSTLRIVLDIGVSAGERKLDLVHTPGTTPPAPIKTQSNPVNTPIPFQEKNQPHQVEPSDTT